MTQEQKDLLLKDICARLIYGVKCVSGVDDATLIVEGINPNCNGASEVQVTYERSGINFDTKISSIKPYLFPLSSMTKEQFEELKVFADLTYEGNTLELVEWDSICDKTLEFWLEEIPSYHVIKVFDWLNKNHFDYRGLIEKGLAIDATNKNIY